MINPYMRGPLLGFGFRELREREQDRKRKKRKSRNTPISRFIGVKRARWSSVDHGVP